MKNIQNDIDYTELRKRIQALSPASARRWGKMDLQQMLVHCTMQLKMALGEVSPQTQGPSFLRSGLGKWMLFSRVPWPKGAQTPNEMNADLGKFSLADIEAGKSDLLGYLEKAREQEQLQSHPFFWKIKPK